jgi:phage shock protein A
VADEVDRQSGSQVSPGAGAAGEESLRQRWSSLAELRRKAEGTLTTALASVNFLTRQVGEERTLEERYLREAQEYKRRGSIDLARRRLMDSREAGRRAESHEKELDRAGQVAAELERGQRKLRRDQDALEGRRQLLALNRFNAQAQQDLADSAQLVAETGATITELETEYSMITASAAARLQVTALSNRDDLSSALLAEDDDKWVEEELKRL